MCYWQIILAFCVTNGFYSLVSRYINPIKKKSNIACIHTYTSLITACVFHINVIIIVFKSRIFDILKWFPCAYKRILYITIPEPTLGITFGDCVVSKFHFNSSEKFCENQQQKDLTNKA